MISSTLNTASLSPILCPWARYLTSTNHLTWSKRLDKCYISTVHLTLTFTFINRTRTFYSNQILLPYRQLWAATGRSWFIIISPVINQNRSRTKLTLIFNYFKHECKPQTHILNQNLQLFAQSFSVPKSSQSLFSYCSIQIVTAIVTGCLYCIYSIVHTHIYITQL